VTTKRYFLGQGPLRAFLREVLALTTMAELFFLGIFVTCTCLLAIGLGG
jgi:hypothetical protein